MLCVKKMSRHGFTLLETMLSVALLLVVSLMVYEGFMSTLSYAADTALAERFSNVNSGKVYDNLGSTTNSAIAAGTTSNAILVSGSGFKAVLQVNVLSESSGSSGFSSTSLMQDANFTTTTHRHGFTYEGRACPSCGELLKYFVEGPVGNQSIVAKCTASDASTTCGYKYNVRAYVPPTSASASASGSTSGEE